MKRVLVGFDGSPQAEHALDELSRSGLGSEVEICVMSVADVWLPANPTGTSDPFPDTRPAAVRHAIVQAQDAIRLTLASAARAAERLALLHPKWRVAPHACGDSPAWALVAKAAEWRADLVVLGSHGRSALERFFLGSVSAKVAAEAPCSVRITRPRENMRSGRLRIVIAVDGSADSQAAVRAVASRVWLPYCEFRVVAVVDPRMETSLAWDVARRDDWLPQPTERARDALTRLLEMDCRVLTEAGLMAETFLLEGEPKRELINLAEGWQADAIFIGARGLHHGGRLSLGTNASAVVSRAHCSVEIVRP